MDERIKHMKVEIIAYQAIEKTVTVSGNSGRVYVPIEWVGKKVKVFLLEPVSNEETTNRKKKKVDDNEKS